MIEHVHGPHIQQDTVRCPACKMRKALTYAGRDLDAAVSGLRALLVGVEHPHTTIAHVKRSIGAAAVRLKDVE